MDIGYVQTQRRLQCCWCHFDPVTHNRESEERRGTWISPSYQELTFSCHNSYFQTVLMHMDGGERGAVLDNQSVGRGHYAFEDPELSVPVPIASTW